MKWSAGCLAGTDPDLSSTYEQQHCEAVLAQKRCVFLVLEDDEAMEGHITSNSGCIPNRPALLLVIQHWCVCMLSKSLSCSSMSRARLNAG